MAKKNITVKVVHQEWLLRTLIAAVFAVVGFIAKDVYQGWRQDAAQKRAATEANLGALKELASLLDESRRIFLAQNEQAERFMRLLRQNHGRKVPNDLGYDDTFYEMYDRFTPQEAALQKLIRSTTLNSQRRVNLALSAWLQRNRAFTQDGQPTPERAALAEQLRTLNLHLNQWNDKFDAWIPNDPKRSLVYLADERADGVGFPAGLNQTIKDVIASWN